MYLNTKKKTFRFSLSPLCRATSRVTHWYNKKRIIKFFYFSVFSLFLSPIFLNILKWKRPNSRTTRAASVRAKGRTLPYIYTVLFILKKKEEKSSEATAGAAQFDCVFMYIRVYTYRLCWTLWNREYEADAGLFEAFLNWLAISFYRNQPATVFNTFT